MEDFRYKEYTEEESAIYNRVMDEIMAALKNGQKFNEVCNAIYVEDKDLKSYIEDDALKIIIADMHFMKGLPLEDVSDTLDISMDRVSKAAGEMMEDIEKTTTEIFMMNNPDSPTGNA
jgi:hypothetical protein